MVTKSKSRLRYILLMVIKSGNSPTQGPHHVAHKFISRNFPDSFFNKFFKPVSPIVSKLTVSVFHSSFSLFTSASFSIHFTEQPKVFVFSTRTGLSANKSSMALRVSKFFGVPLGFSTSSILPLNRNNRALSKIKTCGVAEGPYLLDVP